MQLDRFWNHDSIERRRRVCCDKAINREGREGLRKRVRASEWSG